jgi:multidrug efflux pump subunit AcrB
LVSLTLVPMLRGSDLQEEKSGYRENTNTMGRDFEYAFTGLVNRYTRTLD